MKIAETTYRPSAAQLRRKTTGSAGSTSFADVFSAADAGDAGSTGLTAQASNAAPTTGINPLLSLQEVSDEQSRRTKAIQRAQSQLQALERLRQALLVGAIPPNTLQELQNALARQRDQIEDPALLDILDEVELRVAVELAKLEVAAEMAKGNLA